MKILSLRRGFASDHSSTSYEFLAVDKPLGKDAKAAVSRLSSRTRPTSRRASFIYHADGYDIPGGWEPLMAKYYDVMYSESYDWWTFAFGFDVTPAQLQQLHQYEFDGSNDLGIGVSSEDGRAIVTINCTLDSGELYHLQDNDRYYDEDCDDYDDFDEDSENEVYFGDGLLDMLTQIRQQLANGDYKALYAVWEKYGDGNEENSPPAPAHQEMGGKLISEFKELMMRL